MRHARVLAIGVTLTVLSAVALLGTGAGSVDAPPQAEVLATVEIRDPATLPVPAGVPVVRITALTCGWRSVGSGVLLPGGRVLTARHVLDGADRATVDLGNTQAEATLVAVDRNGRDAALLVAPDLATQAGAAVQPAVDRAAPVWVFGHPGGQSLVQQAGTVLGSLDEGPLALDGGRVLTLDLFVAEGMSGGPVVDEQGAVVGIAVGYESNTRTGIAVPVGEILELLDGSSTGAGSMDGGSIGSTARAC